MALLKCAVRLHRIRASVDLAPLCCGRFWSACEVFALVDEKLSRCLARPGAGARGGRGPRAWGVFPPAPRLPPATTHLSTGSLNLKVKCVCALSAL
eukprot:scaffold114066_cov57-Phaeocystis_antarctica.AAC.2